jgi:hypothetical protein
MGGPVLGLTSTRAITRAFAFGAVLQRLSEGGSGGRAHFTRLGRSGHLEERLCMLRDRFDVAERGLLLWR